MIHYKHDPISTLIINIISLLVIISILSLNYFISMTCDWVSINQFNTFIFVYEGDVYINYTIQVGFYNVFENKLFLNNSKNILIFRGKVSTTIEFI